MKKIFTLIFIISVTGIVISCGGKNSKSSKENNKKETVFIDPQTVLRTIEGVPIGLNINFYLDDDKATNAQVTMVEAIKNIGIKYLRYPGGDKSDEYLFAYPPYEKSEPHPTRRGKNSSLGRQNFMDSINGSDYKYPPMDFDEFIRICRETNSEPIIVVAADTRNHPFPKGVTGVSTAEEMLKNAVEWVRYSNVKKNYGVKYWMIGNECWHNNVKEYYSVDDYIADVKLFADAMKAVDPAIKIIPNASVIGDFTEKLLKGAGDKIDMLCLSNYPFHNSTYDDWASGQVDLLVPYKRVAKQVKEYAPEGKKDMKLIVAEYGPFDFGENGWGTANDLGHAMCNFDMTGKLLLQEQIPFSCYWNSRWEYNSDHLVYNTLDDNNELLPVGWAIKFWGKHLFSKMIAAESSSSALTVFSSHDPISDQIYVYFINKGKEKITVDIDIKNRKVDKIFRVACMHGESPTDISPLTDEKIIEIIDELELPSHSVNVYKLSLKP